LINDNERACLADFGLASIIADKLSGYYTSSLGGGTCRWMAPELLDPEKFHFDKSTPTIESDIFAVGMVIYEVA
jgi:serine/threonine protein kinase